MKITNFAKNYLASMPKIHSLTRQLIPFVPTVLHPSRLRITSFTHELAHYDMTPSMTLRPLKPLLHSLTLSTTKGQTARPIED